MKLNFLELAMIAGLALLSRNLRADVLVGPGGAFQPWTASILGPASSPTYTGPNHPGPYWNNFSGDSPSGNIGWCLVGGGGCVISTPPGALSYYGTATGAAVQNMAFVSMGLPATASLIGQYTNQLGTAANSGYNVFGWYTIDSSGKITATALWNSKSDSIGQLATFTPGPAGTHYGLFLENIQGGGTATEADYFWFMNSSSNYGTGTAGALDGLQHFAVFAGVPGTYFVGVDDTNNGNQDFNNMIVELVTAPEPGTIALFSLWLLFVGLRLGENLKPRRGGFTNAHETADVRNRQLLGFFAVARRRPSFASMRPS